MIKLKLLLISDYSTFNRDNPEKLTLDSFTIYNLPDRLAELENAYGDGVFNKVV